MRFKDKGEGMVSVSFLVQVAPKNMSKMDEKWMDSLMWEIPLKNCFSFCRFELETNVLAVANEYLAAFLVLKGSSWQNSNSYNMEFTSEGDLSDRASARKWATGLRRSVGWEGITQGEQESGTKYPAYAESPGDRPAASLIS